MANCNHDCNSCKSTCSKKDFLAPMNAHSHVKKVIGVVSGKGGVGKFFSNFHYWRLLNKEKDIK